MKLRDAKRLVSKLFHASFAPAFDRCHNISELEVVAETLMLAGKLEEQRERDMAKLHGEEMSKLLLATAKLDARIMHLESEAERRTKDMLQMKIDRAQAEQRPVNELEPKMPQTLFDVGLLNPGLNKIGVIKAVRMITNLGLKEAKDLVDESATLGMRMVLRDASLSAANKAAEQLREVGAEVSVR
jgi:ribosomal protein L7/L12